MSHAAAARPIVFLDFDDVICLNNPYGGYDALVPNPPLEIWAQLFHAPAVEVLRKIAEQFNPRFVITTSWLMLMNLERCRSILTKGGLAFVASNLHWAWDAEQGRGMNRLAAIEVWLRQHHKGEPFAVLDDVSSGTGLPTSSLAQQGRVVLCEVDVGLQDHHFDQVRQALTRMPSELDD